MQHRVRLIAASPNMCDPNFKETLILLLENDADGAFGFILNRMRDLDLGDVFQGEEALGPEEFKVWFGGPVDETRGFLLCDSHELRKLGILWNESDDDQLSIREGLFTTANPSITKEIIWQYFDSEQSLSIVENFSNEHDQAAKIPFRFFLGYAGWGPKQIEEEALAGWWLDVPWDKNLIMSTRPDQMWTKSIASLGIHSPASYVNLNSDFIQ